MQKNIMLLINQSKISTYLYYNSVTGKVMNRLQNIAAQLSKAQISEKKSDDVVICSAVRTPVTKAKKGYLKDTAPELMLSFALKAAAQRANIEPKEVQDIVVGCNLQPGGGQINARMGMFLANFPDTTPIVTINRLCSSGLESCSIVAAKIKSGVIDIGIGSGVQSMSFYKMSDWVREDLLAKETLAHKQAMETIMSLGITSQNVAEKYGVNRQKQDKMAFESHQKAAKAQQSGLFKNEIIPVSVKVKDNQGNQKQVVCSEDDGIRKATTMESLAKLKPAFKKDGSTTAGNSSQISDGAAAVVLARRSTAQKLGMPILAKFVDYAVKGCPPSIMGIGPAIAIPELLKKTGKTVEDIDIWEINEAFASQATYCVEKLGIDMKKVNPKGGAIALGHPLGCTGSRQMATLLPEMQRTGAKLGVISMCIGGGMGAAALIERQ